VNPQPRTLCGYCSQREFGNPPNTEARLEARGVERKASKTRVVPPMSGNSADEVAKKKKLAVCFWGWDLGMPMRVWEHSGQAGGSTGERGFEERAPKTQVVPLHPGTAPIRSQFFFFWRCVFGGGIWARRCTSGSARGEQAAPHAKGFEQRAPKARVVPPRPGTAPIKSQFFFFGGVFLGVGLGHADARLGALGASRRLRRQRGA
jgi:hypothetical protein